MTRCKNCDTEVERNFCPECGQRSVDLERPVLELASELLRELLDIDGRVARTLRALLTQPGVLTSAFLAGQRRRYTSPVRLYLVISLLFFVLAAWLAGRGVLLEEGQTLETDAAEQARLISNYLPRLMFVLLPVFALLLKAAFRRRLYFDHLVHSLHLHSVGYLALALLLPLEARADESLLALAVQLLVTTYLVASFIVSVRRVYAVSWLAAGIKAVGITMAYVVLVSGTMELTGQLTLPESAALPFLTD